MFRKLLVGKNNLNLDIFPIISASENLVSCRIPELAWNTLKISKRVCFDPLDNYVYEKRNCGSHHGRHDQFS